MNIEEEFKKIMVQHKKQQEMILALNNQILNLTQKISRLENDLIKKERALRSEIRSVANK